jgi:hypothetical protein
MDKTRAYYLQAMRRLEMTHQEDLDAKGAIEMQAEQEFIGYIRREPDGRFSNEIISWGVNHGKQFYGETIEAVKDAAFRVFG